MANITLPKNYKSELNLYETQIAIKTVKDFFQTLLAEQDALSDGGGGVSCYTSDQAADFQRLASLFLGEDSAIQAQQIDISQY